jgi:hypothetical protein
MSEEQEDINKHDRVRKLLKDLPPVSASPDFEARLRRRISEPERARVEAGWMERFFGARRIPAFAYSLVALLSVGVISYYMFRHEDVAPKMEFKDASPPVIMKDNEKIQQAPVLKKDEADKKERDDLSVGAKKPDESRKARMQSEPSNQPSPAGNPARLQQGRTHAGPSAQGLQQNVQSVQQNASRPAESQREEMSLPSVAPPPDNMNAVNESAAAAAERSLVGKAATGAAPKMKSGYNVQERFMRSMTAPQIRESQGIILDSAALADSAKVDSIRRAQQRKLLLEKPKPKPKKPPL